MGFYNAVENFLRHKNFPHLKLLSEETEAQNKSTKNVQLEHQVYIFFFLKGKRKSFICSTILKSLQEKCDHSLPCFEAPR